MRLERLVPELEPAYDAFFARLPASSLFQCLRYRTFLRKMLDAGSATPTVEDHYLVALDGDRVVGAIPAFVKRNARYGNVVNSLPFVGSNGGVMVDATAVDYEPTFRFLLKGFHDFCDSVDAISSTIVNRPIDPDDVLYDTLSEATAMDERIGQVTTLPVTPEGATDAAIDAEIMLAIHSKTRNVVRKAIVSGVTVRHDGELETLRFLADAHAEGARVIGAPAKPWSVFEAIREHFRYDEDYRVYVAEKDGERIGGLLVFFVNRVAEYFTPVTIAEHRIFQPQSLLCFRAMRDARLRGCTHWNWGGTAKSQTGVYDFKSRWGTSDLRYRYFVRERRRSLRALSPQTLLEEYPYFFTVPFSVLGT
jgi:hypothetical protein